MTALTPKQLGVRIKKIREFLNFSQEEAARHLNIPRQSFSQIENGQRSVDGLELLKLSELFSVSADDLLKRENIFYSGRTKKNKKFHFDEQKLKNVILYILEKCGGKPNLGETVLYKLLYFIDFNNYELYGKPITGMRYVKLQFGPVPKTIDYQPVINEMMESGELKIINQNYHGKIQKRYIALKEAEIKGFSVLEMKIIDKVISTLSEMNATQIEEYAHGDAPWKCAENNKEIGYNLVYYRSAPYAQRDYDEVSQEISGSDALKTLGSLSEEEYRYYKNL